MELNIFLIAAMGVFFFGIAKGGFVGPISLLAVPLMSLVMSPLKAAGILLPLLVLMDIIAGWIFWKKWNIKILKIIKFSVSSGPCIKLKANSSIHTVS